MEFVFHFFISLPENILLFPNFFPTHFLFSANSFRCFSFELNCPAANFSTSPQKEAKTSKWKTLNTNWTDNYAPNENWRKKPTPTRKTMAKCPRVNFRMEKIRSISCGTTPTASVTSQRDREREERERKNEFVNAKYLYKYAVFLRHATAPNENGSRGAFSGTKEKQNTFALHKKISRN